MDAQHIAVQPETHRFAVLNMVHTLLDVAKTDPVPEYLQYGIV